MFAHLYAVMAYHVYWIIPTTLGLIHAATPSPDPSNPWDGWTGKPDSSPFDSFKLSIKQISGWGFFFIGLAAIVMVGLGAWMVSTAGKNQAKAQDGTRAASNAVKGLGIAFIGIPVLVVFMGAIIKIT